MRFLVALFLVFGLIFAPRTAAADELVLWHAYDEGEAAALAEILDLFRAEHPGLEVNVVRLPFGVLSSRLSSAIPTGNGPHVFIDAHERLGGYVQRDLVRPFSAGATDPDLVAEHALALEIDGERFGLPLSIKSLALFVNLDLAEAPSDGDTLESLLDRSFPESVWPLAMEGESAYFAAPFFHAEGAEFLNEAGEYGLNNEGAERALTRLANLFERGVIPDEPSGALVARLFSSGQAAYAISGPWFAADLPAELNYAVAPLPDLESGGELRPFATVEGALLANGRSTLAAEAELLVRFLASETAATIRAREARQVVSHSRVLQSAVVVNDPLLSGFRRAGARSVLMPSHPHMSQTFEPTARAIRRVVRGGAEPEFALEEAERRFVESVRPPPEEKDPSLALVLIGLVLLGIAFIAVRKARTQESRLALSRSLTAYKYVFHAFIAVGVLVMGPLLVGTFVSFFAGQGTDLHYVGLANYLEILGGGEEGLFAVGSFLVVLLVTVLWTVINLVLHVTLGVSLALLLHQPGLRFRAGYRVLLILPWAVPNYVTALAWKGMFHKQYGAINAILDVFGVEPVSWFSRFATAFSANITTNVWLGFPFMMVVALGALSAVPQDLFDAAKVDGATRWQRIRHISLPLIWPSLLPAVAMGAIWTFNMFNVVFLVSGGEPNGGTEILVSEAYRWAFTRGSRYGYAAAYAVLIFLVLLMSSSVWSKIHLSKKTES